MAVSSDPAVATAVIGSGPILTVTSTGLGTATVKVTAQDVDGQTETSFTVTCRDAEQTVDLYPVPVKKDGVLNIRMGEQVNGTVELTLYSMSNARVFRQELQMADGQVRTVDISALGAGNYRVVVKYKNEEITRNISKL
ncbi:MAG: T9SS type A sorting domain-containing protein [Rikenellaceae bacterium]|nr:T9SS type A sorting domain-containing protein [Rikenellaceae bacterium]